MMKDETEYITIGAIEGSIIITPVEIEEFKNRGVNLLEMLQSIQKDIYGNDKKFEK